MKSEVKLGILGVLALIMVIFCWSSFYVVDQGNVAIVKHFGKAEDVAGPGLHFKMPIRDSIEFMQVRMRHMTETLPAATSEQMPAKVKVSANWIMNKHDALQMYKDYGSLKDFENQILLPKLKSAAKAGISLSTAEALIKNRNVAVNDVDKGLSEAMKEFTGVRIDSVQIEDIDFPPSYIHSILAKQNAKNMADAEAQKLRQQDLQSQQAINTARSNAKATRMTAEAKAYATQIQGQAEADAIRAKAKALHDNPLIVALTKAQRWNGNLPHTVLGNGQNMFLQLKQ